VSHIESMDSTNGSSGYELKITGTSDGIRPIGSQLSPVAINCFKIQDS